MKELYKIIGCTFIMLFIFAGCTNISVRNLNESRYVRDGRFLLDGVYEYSYIIVTDGTIEFVNVDLSEYLKPFIESLDSLGVFDLETGESRDIVFADATDEEMDMAISLLSGIFENPIPFMCEREGDVVNIFMLPGEFRFILVYDVESNSIKVGNQYFVLDEYGV